MFYFVIDEIDSAPVLNRFLREILAAGGPSRKCITAYALICGCVLVSAQRQAHSGRSCAKVWLFERTRCNAGRTERLKSVLSRKSV
jgi:hypothetical protein